MNFMIQIAEKLEKQKRDLSKHTISSAAKINEIVAKRMKRNKSVSPKPTPERNVVEKTRAAAQNRESEERNKVNLSSNDPWTRASIGHDFKILTKLI